jgi:hypothetical protein
VGEHAAAAAAAAAADADAAAEYVAVLTVKEDTPFEGFEKDRWGGLKQQQPLQALTAA